MRFEDDSSVSSKKEVPVGVSLGVEIICGSLTQEDSAIRSRLLSKSQMEAFFPVLRTRTFFPLLSILRGAEANDGDSYK